MVERSFSLFSYLRETKSGSFGVGVIMQKLIQILEKSSQNYDTCKISCGLLRLGIYGHAAGSVSMCKRLESDRVLNQGQIVSVIQS